jgi:hypothetical protein
MSAITRRMRISVGTALVAAATSSALVVAPAGAAKKTSHKFSVNLKGNALSGSFKGKPFGACTTKGRVIGASLAKAIETVTCKGGTWTTTFVNKSGLANESHGTLTITGGTGKYKGARGKGTFTGNTAAGTANWKGTIIY